MKTLKKILQLLLRLCESFEKQNAESEDSGTVISYSDGTTKAFQQEVLGWEEIGKKDCGECQVPYIVKVEGKSKCKKLKFSTFCSSQKLTDVSFAELEEVGEASFFECV